MITPRALLPLLICALMVVSACSAVTTDNGAEPHTPEGSEFTTTFTRIAESGYIDMGLDFENPTSAAVTVDGRLVARDANGAVLPDVRVTTAFGTESGRAVVLPGANVDLVQLEGRGEQQVREITLETADVTVLDVSPETQYVELKSLDGDGRELDYDIDAQKVSFENPNPFPVRIRVVLMILAAPRQGVPQEAALVQDVTTVEAKGSGSTVVALDAGTRRLLRQHGSTSFVTLRPVLAP
ncbi:hypothetical protein [Nocardioides sp. SYSU D00038]|uniref:hypothetical protein n=1 Tax=Nocardioides sp. SYSU D00038 TaxID=2812554 RepID=UPI0019671A6C|nr:hypothetical protein [Nocardioides sp. SYSU D00038]